MLIRKDRLRDLMKEHGNNSYHYFARALGVEVAQLHRILNHNSEAGAKFLGCLMRFCRVISETVRNTQGNNNSDTM
ncbi:MAG: hypothetical protein ACOY3U_02370 [Bacillota bacterium]